MKCYVVMFTDRWEEDFFPMEVWLDKSIAEKRAETLTANHKNKSMTDGKRDFYYEVFERPFNEPTTEKT